MRIAATGTGGRLGNELVRRGCIPIESNILDFDGLKAELERIAPDAVINAAAYTSVDEAENKEENEKAIKTNVTGAGNVRIAFPGYLIHLSTSYVFDGSQVAPYKEEDETGPIGAYAWSKWGGEAAILGTMNEKPTLIARTVSLYGGPSKKGDFVTYTLEKLRSLKSDESLSVPDTLYSTPTYIPHLAQGLIKAAELRACGLLHISGRTPVSRFTWAQLIADEWKFDRRVILVDINENPEFNPLARPLRASLDTSKAKSLGIPLGYLVDGLREMHSNEN